MLHSVSTSRRAFVPARKAKHVLRAAVASAAILSGPIYAQNINWNAGAADGLWTSAGNWAGNALPGPTDTAVFNLNLATTIDLGGSNQQIDGFLFNQASVYILTNGSFTLNNLTQTGNVSNEVRTAITTKSSGTDILTANVTANSLQLQAAVTAGGITKTGAGTLRLGTSGATFTNAINGNIVINAGTLQAAANNAGNPLGGTGNVTIGAAGVTLSLTAQADLDFQREVVANNNSFNLTGAAAATDNGDFQMGIGRITTGNATMTVTTGSGYRMRTSELAINSGATTTVNTGAILLVGKLTGDATTKIVKTGTSELRIQANADNAASFAGDIDLAAGTLVLEGASGQPLGNADTQINITAANPTVSLRADAAQTFNGVNINAGNNSFNLDVRAFSGTPATATLTGGTVTIGNATMNIIGDRHTARLAGLVLNPGATTTLNVNNFSAVAQTLRLDSLTGDENSTLNRIGSQGVTFSPTTPAFSGKITLNGATTTVESSEVGNALTNAQSLTFLNGSTLNLRSEVDADYGVGIKFGPSVISSTISADRLSAGATKVATLGDVNPTSATLTLTSGNNYGYALDSVTVDAGGTGTLNVTTNGTGVVTTGALNLPANSTLNKIGASTMNFTGDSSGTATGAINIRVGNAFALSAGSLGSGLVTVGNTTANSAGFLLDFSRLNWNAVGASGNVTGVDAVAVAGGAIDLNVTPAVTDVFEIRADGRIQGNAAQLQALTVGTNLTLASDSIVVHEQPGAATATVQGLANNAQVFYGLGANATTLPTIGAGTPWKGLSADNAGRTIQGTNLTTPAIININGGDNNPDTVEATLQSMSDQSFNFGSTTGGYTWTTTAAGGEKVTLAIRGAVGSSALGLVPGGRVIFNRPGTTGGTGANTGSGLDAAVDKIIVQSGALALLANNALGGVPVDVLNGGSLDIGSTNGSAIDGTANIKSGGVLYLNDNTLLTGSGAITIGTGGKLDITGSAPANILKDSAQQIAFTGTGHTVRFVANEVLELDQRVPDAGANFVVAGGTSQTTAFGDTTIGATAAPILVNTQSAGLSLEDGVLTNGPSTTAYVGDVKLNNSNVTIAATRGTSFIVAGDVETTKDIQIGSLTAIDGRDKSTNSAFVNSLGVADPYNSAAQVLIMGEFAAHNVTVNNSHFAIGNANSTITGDLTVNGGVFYADGGGPITAGANSGQLTPKLAAGTLANRIIIGPNSRIETKLDLASDSNATVLNVDQAFVINGDINPQDNRKMWISRNSGTNNRVNLNNVTLMEGSVFGVNEDSTDVRASLKLAGNATVSTPNANTNLDYINISRDASLPAFNGTNPVVLTQGRVNMTGWQTSNNTVANVFGTIGTGVQIDLVRGQLVFQPGSTLDGVVRTQTAAVGIDPIVLSTATNGATTDSTIGGTGRIELGRSVAANGPEDFEIRGAEVASGTAPLHTHAGEIRVVNDGNASTVDGIVRSNRTSSDLAVTARVQVNSIVLEPGATVQLTSFSAIPLAVSNISAPGGGTIDTAVTGVTVNTVNAGTSTVTFTGAQPLTLTNPITAGQVNVNSTRLTIPGDLNSALSVSGNGAASLTGNVSGALSVTTSAVSFDAGGGTKTVGGPVTLDNGNIAIANGTLDFGTTVLTSTPGQTVAGLREGRYAGSFNLTTPNDSDVVKLGPVMAQSTTGWNSNETFVYTGQFFLPDNNGDGTGTFAFAENFDDSVRVVVDGVQIVNNGVFNDATGSGGRILSAGWHDVEFRFGQGGGSVGPVNSDGWNGTLAFGIDLNTVDGFDGIGANPIQTQYIAPLDNGSMNLFRTTVASDLSIGTNSTIRAGGFTNIGRIGLTGLGSGVTLTSATGPAVLSTASSIEISTNASGRVEVTRAGDKLTVGSAKLGGNLVVAGQGDLTVNGNTTGTGTVTMDSTGVLTMNGTVDGATIINSGTLKGNGTFNAGITLNGGGIAPGQSPGVLSTTTLFVNGPSLFEFEVGSALAAGAAQAGVNFDQLVITGDQIDLNNATLSLVVSSALKTNDVLTLILNNGTDADPGVFNGIANGALIDLSGGYQVQISYFDDASVAGLQFAGGNDVSVMVTIPEPSAAMALLGGLTTLAGMRRFRRRNS